MRAKPLSMSPIEVLGHSKNCDGFRSTFLNEKRGSYCICLLQEMEHNCKTQAVNYFVLNRQQIQTEC